MKIDRCLHSALLVSDLERAEHFYGTVLGLPKVDRTLRFPGVWYQVGTYQIHLIVDTNLKVNLQNKEKWGRNSHIAFSIDNLEAAKTRLENSGFPVQTSASGRAALFTRDPDGNVIELSVATGKSTH
ncbi:VOC family protein [Oscillatoriales cyanobacterium LEGE 11467]|uniref:VOC family protein n=1 Tax=Zarconia navalis LEGE 11467 TaxID=1828826 RepID=A0A928VW20_9CYAN|nr:VOC family protein [Zarconia navalis]MBE9041292.1 VOC family protein [Zarconia navalis LEGE 11467]